MQDERVIVKVDQQIFSNEHDNHELSSKPRPTNYHEAISLYHLSIIIIIITHT